MLPSGNYVKLPLPWGYNVFHVMGQAIGEAITRKDNNHAKSALRVATSAIDAFNPVGNGGSITQVLTPSIFRPVVQWLENKDWTGQKLRPDSNVFAPVPNAYRYWGSARKPSQYIAKKLNELTGGNEIIPGWSDRIPVLNSPEAIDMAWDTITGGSGRFYMDTVSTPVKLAKGEKVESYEIPFARRVWGRVGDRAMMEDYFKRSDELNLISRAVKYYATDPKKMNEIINKYADDNGIKGADARTKVMTLVQISTAFGKAIDDLKMRKGKIKDEPTRSKIDDKVSLLMRQFNKKYISITKGE
jgi:hypothetical protein